MFLFSPQRALLLLSVFLNVLIAAHLASSAPAGFFASASDKFNLMSKQAKASFLDAKREFASKPVISDLKAELNKARSASTLADKLCAAQNPDSPLSRVGFFKGLESPYLSGKYALERALTDIQTIEQTLGTAILGHNANAEHFKQLVENLIVSSKGIRKAAMVVQSKGSKMLLRDLEAKMAEIRHFASSLSIAYRNWQQFSVSILQKKASVEAKAEAYLNQLPGESSLLIFTTSLIIKKFGRFQNLSNKSRIKDSSPPKRRRNLLPSNRASRKSRRTRICSLADATSLPRAKLNQSCKR